MSGCEQNLSDSGYGLVGLLKTWYIINGRKFLYSRLTVTLCRTPASCGLSLGEDIPYNFTSSCLMFGL